MNLDGILDDEDVSVTLQYNDFLERFNDDEMKDIFRQGIRNAAKAIVEVESDV